MSQKNETVVLIATLLVTAAILGAGFWWFTRQSGVTITQNQPQTTPIPTLTATPTPTANITFPPPTNVPSGTTVRINGSTSMVQINQALKNAFEQQFPGTSIITMAEGSDQGIEAVRSGNTDIAAISKPLTPEEEAQGLVSIPVAKDSIAIVVNNLNTFRTGLTKEQVMGIFQGKITDWSAVGGQPGTIRVINRPPVSGTRQVFQELVLQGGDFGTSNNISTMERDATTPILQALGNDGISYATYSQVANQMTVRTAAVAGLTPEAPDYPYQRILYYAYKQPASDAVQAFLGYITSPAGQQAIAGGN